MSRSKAKAEPQRRRGAEGRMSKSKAEPQRCGGAEGMTSKAKAEPQRRRGAEGRMSKSKEEPQRCRGAEGMTSKSKAEPQRRRGAEGMTSKSKAEPQRCRGAEEIRLPRMGFPPATRVCRDVPNGGGISAAHPPVIDDLPSALRPSDRYVARYPALSPHRRRPEGPCEPPGCGGPPTPSPKTLCVLCASGVALFCSDVEPITSITLPMY